MYLALSCFLLCTVPWSIQSTPEPSLADIAWLSGAWVTEDDTTEEIWTIPKGDILLGLGRSIMPNGTLFYEYLRIEKRADGIYYVATPASGTAVAFKLTQSSKDLLVFTNPAHDFPTEIRYERKGDKLCASIAGPANSGEQAKQWCFKRKPM